MTRMTKRDHNFHSLKNKKEPRRLFGMQGPETNVIGKTWDSIILLPDVLI